jgi:hypothetical protein
LQSSDCRFQIGMRMRSRAPNRSSICTFPSAQCI